jgi:uncharacterized membrane protein
MTSDMSEVEAFTQTNIFSLAFVVVSSLFVMKIKVSKSFNSIDVFSRGDSSNCAIVA